MKRLALTLLICLSTTLISAQTANILISCDRNTDPDTAGYKWYWNGRVVGTTEQTKTGITPTWSGSVDMLEGNNYAQVSAYDSSGNYSELSKESNIIKVDTIPPQTPTGCSVQKFN